MSTDSIPQRTCTMCNQAFPATLEYFHKQRNGKYGLSSWCIVCHRQRNKENSAKLHATSEYKEKRRLYDEKRYQGKRDYYIAHNHRYYEENHEKELERTRIKYRVKFDQYRPQRLKRGRERYEKNKEEIRKSQTRDMQNAWLMIPIM